MPSPFLVLDIETVVDPALYTPPPPSQTPPEQERPFPPLYAHRPILIGALWLDAQGRFERFQLGGEGQDEAAMLGEFSRQLSEQRPLVVTYNGRGFDLPVLALRCLRHGVPLPYFHEDPRARHASGGLPHFDLCEFLSERGSGRGLGLDA